MPTIPGLPSYAPILLIVLLVLAFRMRGLTRARPLKLERMWIAPVLMLAAAVAVISEAPPQGLDWLWIAVGLAIGAGLGWLRGKTMRIEVDPDSHVVTAKGSQAAMAFIPILVAVRFILRSYLAANASTLHLSFAAITDAFLALALGVVCVARLEMALRARRLLAQARAAGSHEVMVEGTD